MRLRWGVVGCGSRSYDFIWAVQTQESEKHQIVAITSNNLKAAKKFASRHKIPKVHENAKELGEDTDVDIVYICLVTSQHLPACKLMLDLGKHVLCEAPLTINRKQTKELIEYAKQKGLFLMEGLWSRFFPVYEEMTKLINEGAVGDVLHVNVEFGLPMEQWDPVTVKKVGGSAILDMGIYGLQFIQYVYRGMKPEVVVAWGELNNAGTDIKANAEIKYSHDRSASVAVDVCTQLSNTAVVSGTKGKIVILLFWCPRSLIFIPTFNNSSHEKTIICNLPESPRKFFSLNKVGFAYQVEEIRKCIGAGLLESPKLMHVESLQLAELTDFLRKKVGTVFPQDT